MTCGQVWWPILGICALHLTHPSAHTQQWVVNKHTHREHTPGAVGSPGSSWSFSALLKGLTSVMVLRVERVLDIHSPHRPCRTWDSNPWPLGYKSVSISIRPRLMWLALTKRYNIFYVTRGLSRRAMLMEVAGFWVHEHCLPASSETACFPSCYSQFE